MIYVSIFFPSHPYLAGELTNYSNAEFSTWMPSSNQKGGEGDWETAAKQSETDGVSQMHTTY